MKKKALITGITGQDGSYLSEFLLKKNYKVHGLVRRVALEDENHRLWRLRHLLNKISLHPASLESYESLVKLIQRIKPHEIYHLGAQSYVDYSFKDEFSTLNTNINGTHYLMSAIKEFSPKTKFYFAGSSEMFGRVREVPQTEKTPFHPRSVYGISKVAGFDLTRNYREAYGLFASNGILFNHESPLRGETFVTRKITKALSRIKLGKQKVLFKSDTNDQEKILELFKNDNELNPYFDVYKSYQYNVELIDNIFELTLTKYGIIEIEQSLLDQAIEIVRKRVDEVGTNEPSITKSGSNRIAVELPGLDNPDRIKSLLGRTANLTFRFVTQNTDASFGSEKLKDLDTGEELNVSKRIIISGDNLIDAKPQMDNINNETVVSFTLDRLGARKFGRATKNGIGKQLAIVLDNQIISAPVIRDVIASGSGQISGGFTFQSATDLALLLRSGALPAPLDIIEERTVGPDLGEDSIKAGVLSLIIGFILVILYMI